MPSKSIKLCNKVKKGPWGTVEPGNTIFKECWQQGNNKCCVEAPGIQLHLFLSYFFYCPVYLSRWIDQIIHLSIYLPPNLSPTLRSGHNRHWPWLLHHRWWHYLADSAVKKKHAGWSITQHQCVQTKGNARGPAVTKASLAMAKSKRVAAAIPRNACCKQ
jgi:hypothetical protein